MVEDCLKHIVSCLTLLW